jgi:hypothetical protein
VCIFYADRKSKMATTAGHRLTLDPKGKMFKCLLLRNYKSMYCGCGYLGFTIGIKNIYIIHVQCIWCKYSLPLRSIHRPTNILTKDEVRDRYILNYAFITHANSTLFQ